MVLHFVSPTLIRYRGGSWRKPLMPPTSVGGNRQVIYLISIGIFSLQHGLLKFTGNFQADIIPHILKYLSLSPTEIRQGTLQMDGNIILTNQSTLGSMQLKVIIVGGGIGGLTAAVALRKQGHEVHVS